MTNPVTTLDASGRLRVEPMANRAFVDGVAVALRPTAVDTLDTIARGRGRAVPVWRIRRELWNEANRRPEPVDPVAAIQIQVCLLRAALRVTAARIVTERGVGYRLSLEEARRATEFHGGPTGIKQEEARRAESPTGIKQQNDGEPAR